MTHDNHLPESTFLQQLPNYLFHLTFWIFWKPNTDELAKWHVWIGVKIPKLWFAISVGSPLPMTNPPHIIQVIQLMLPLCCHVCTFSSYILTSQKTLYCWVFSARDLKSEHIVCFCMTYNSSIHAFALLDVHLCIAHIYSIKWPLMAFSRCSGVPPQMGPKYSEIFHHFRDHILPLIYWVLLLIIIFKLMMIMIMVMVVGLNIIVWIILLRPLVFKRQLHLQHMLNFQSLRKWRKYSYS